MPCIGLALGGGGVRGLAHIGVLRALERAGVNADVICGTSAGAIIGASYAAGMPTEEMIGIVRELRWTQFMKPALRRNSVLDTTVFDAFLEKVISARNFDELHCSYAAIACDSVTGERVVLAQGDPARAARASAAIRNVLPPVEIDGRLLIDGINVDAVPVAVTRTLGADYVIAVDVGHHRARQERELDLRGEADRIISIVGNKRSAWDFTRALDVIAAGEAATEARLADITADLALRVPRQLPT
jgi:NTE family protein